MLTAEFHGLVRVWNIAAGKGGEPYDLADGGPLDGYLATHDGSRRIAVVEGRLTVLDRIGRAVGPPLQDVIARDTAWLSPDGRRVAIGKQANGFRIWDVASGNPLTDWFGGEGVRVPRCAIRSIGATPYQRRARGQCVEVACRHRKICGGAVPVWRCAILGAGVSI